MFTLHQKFRPHAKVVARLCLITIIIFVINNWFLSKVFAEDFINHRLSLLDTKTNFSPTPVQSGPAGTFTITATFKNISADKLTGLAFRVVQLTGGNLLLNAGPGSLGSTLTVPFTGNYLDGVLSTGENFKVDFIIGLASRNQFTFFVDALGAVVVPVDITADTGQQVFGPATHWQTRDGDLIVEHLAGARHRPGGRSPRILVVAGGVKWEVAVRECLGEHRSPDHLPSTDELAGTRRWGHRRTPCRPEPDGRPARVLPIVGCAGGEMAGSSMSPRKPAS